MLGAIAYSQEATYWEPLGQSGFGGFTYNTPQLIYVRWEERTDKFVNSVGEEKIAKAVVYTPERGEVGAYIALGDHSLVTDPTSLDNAYEIQRADSIPDLRGLHQEHRNFL